ncbi:MAG TPA: recombinase family protein [Candidatus Obscuribacter sp.]|nr:recombinase family protein [Candidatus Obscuribacter sp.]
MLRSVAGTALRFLAYLRKSSEPKDKQALSIPAQRRELSAYAERQELQLVGKHLEETRSAMTPGRPVFNEVMNAIESGKANAILCWKLDRLARNPLDGGRIMQALADGKLKQIVTPGYAYSSSSSDKMLMAIQFGMATKYSDDLSDNVRRGIRETLLRGYWPSRPPLGYRREEEAEKRLVPDPMRFGIVQELWRMLLTGVPVLQILAFTRERELTTPKYKKSGGGLLSRTELYRLFQNRFYTGVMLFAGELYPGKHQPMITAAEFTKARAILAGRQAWNLPPARPVYVYRGLLHCASCGGQITVKTTTNRHGKKYIHYYCWKKNLRHQYCPEGAVQESEIDQALLNFIDELELPPTWVTTVLSKLDTLKGAARAAAEQSRRQQEEQLCRVERQLERLRQLLIDDIITAEDYTSDKNKLLNKQARLQEKLAEPLSTADPLEPWRDGLSLLTEAKKLFASSDPAKKRELVKSLTWNLTLKDKKVLIEAKKIFSVVREGRGCPNERAFWDFLRTHITLNEGKTER